ncbi:glycine/betaine ABC transporter permease [Actinorhabdospora filicis]|uniref:Glycine/betaine ABC transporter permease n=1 Tax=Actinorhabdospora filicis TaxID=1785913 RepID=A0A9W6WBZ4_9ACTN|nr:ABC transporter permease [Actinorhabdospora filicis]GLZ80573.1 glycine/betaine ABC transporter permease [Actinorhabdospora filicis]
MSFPVAGHALAANSDPWFTWSYVRNNADALGAAFTEHVTLTALTMLFAALLAVPLGVLAYKARWLTAPILALSGVLYTVPSLALFALLAPFLGLTMTTVLVGLVMYALLIIVRGTLTGLRQVPEEVRDAARGMGYGGMRMLTRIELPLAMPSILTGLRIAAVSTVALVTVGAVLGKGGLGGLILSGFRNNLYKPQILTATVLCVALALVCDVLLAWAGRLLTPWTKGARA